MIVTRRDGAFSLVEQVEHGRVAGELAAHWGNELFESPTPRTSVCTAAAKHDEGWRAWDARILLNEVEKRPLHFLEIDTEEHIRLYRQGVEWVSLADVYAGVLVGMHWTGIYRGRWSRPAAQGRLRANDADLRRQDRVVDAEEIRWIEAKRAAWAEEEPRSAFESRLWHNYELLQLFDLLSLYLCVMPPEVVDRDDSAAPRRWGPQLTRLSHYAETVLLPVVRAGPFGAARQITVGVHSPGVVSLDPYPFQVPGVQIDVAHVVVPDREYTHAELGQQVRSTPSSVTTWWLEPAGLSPMPD